MRSLEVRDSEVGRTARSAAGAGRSGQAKGWAVSASRRPRSSRMHHRPARRCSVMSYLAQIARVVSPTETVLFLESGRGGAGIRSPSLLSLLSGLLKGASLDPWEMLIPG